MITFVERSDLGYVDSLARHPLVAPFVTHDGLREQSFADVLLEPDTFFLRADVDGVPCGGFLFRKNEVHTMLLPPLRGRLAVRAGKQACDWLRQHRGWSEMTSYCFSCHPQTLWFARQVGFSIQSTIDEDLRVGGRPVLTHKLVYRF